MSDLPAEDDDQYIPTDKRKQPTTITRIIIAALVAFVLLVLIDWRYVNEHSERVRFLTVNSLSLLVVVIIAIQSVIYRREWRVMQQGLLQTDRMIDKMHEQLEVIQKQAGFMEKQLSETHQMVVQNERVVKAAEQSTKIAQETLEVGDAPYFGITGMTFTDFELDRYPGVDFGLLNGGKTPAWHVHTMVVLIFGDDIESGESFRMQQKITSPANNFYPSDEGKTLEYKQIRFPYTEENRRAIANQVDNRDKAKSQKFLFVIITLSYEDRRGVRQNSIFEFVWHHSFGQFVDTEALLYL